MTDKVLAWHFCKADRMTQFEPRQPIAVGKTLRFDGTPKLCKQGFHGSRRLLDALSYAPGPVLCRVELSGIIVPDTDKAVATERTPLWMVDATKELDQFARWCALQVIHLWDAPPVVKEFLETGNENLRAAAGDAAWSAARDAARATARDAARATARDAAWATAWDAARATARDAARDAAWATAEDAQRRKLSELLEPLKDRS